MKKFFLVALVATMFAACTNEKVDGTQDNKGSAYLAIEFPKARVKAGANTPESGTTDEGNITSAIALLFDENGVCLGKAEFGGLTSGTASSVKSVPAKTKKIFVVVNNFSGWNFSDSNIIGKTWAQLNSYLDVTVADIATNGQFMMTNTGDNVKGALVDVAVHSNATDAAASPAEVFVDRLAAKVSVTANGTQVTNGTFTFSGWELNTVNKSTIPYSERVTYTGSTTATIAAVYRKDKNYLKADYSSDAVYLNANFTWLVNTPNVSPVTRAVGTAAYCTENTMDADAQLVGYTTKVVIKAKFAPTAIVGSYFMWDQKYYTTADFTTEYKTDATMKADLLKFLEKAVDGFNGAAADDAAIDAAIAALDANSGIKGRYMAVRYYHDAVCYYDALIRHDNGIDVLMALGRYGVVRNNSYEINIAKVSGPGTPWITNPVDPEDPSKPTDPDDEIPANLAVKVTVNPWTKWVHDVELGQ